MRQGRRLSKLFTWIVDTLSAFRVTSPKSWFSCACGRCSCAIGDGVMGWLRLSVCEDRRMKSRSEEEKGAGIEEGRENLLSLSDARCDFVRVAMDQGSDQGREMMLRDHLSASIQPDTFPFPFPFSRAFSTHDCMHDRIMTLYVGKRVSALHTSCNMLPEMRIYFAVPTTRAYYINVSDLGHDAPLARSRSLNHFYVCHSPSHSVSTPQLTAAEIILFPH